MKIKRLLVVHHSQSGHTAHLASAVVQGSRSVPNIDVISLRAMEAGINDLLACDAIIFGSPENLGYLSGGLKDFFDRTFYPAQPHQLCIPYAVFISAGNDGRGAVSQLQRIAKGYPMREAVEPIIIRGEITNQDLNQCRELGEALATGLSMGIF